MVTSCSQHEPASQSIPLPEHPRPDFERADWVNLNGSWNFEFDSLNLGEAEKWNEGNTDFSQQIIVPFPWGSTLSRVADEADIAWYKRNITIPADWKGQRVFLKIGASDWLTKGWIDGKPVGSYQGGYTPFEFELTEYARFGEQQQIVLRVDDTPHDFKLFGKQGYGNARGIWQTVYLEARPADYIANFYFTPDIDQEKLMVRVVFDKVLSTDSKVILQHIEGQENTELGATEIKAGATEANFEVAFENQKLWSLEDPYLYEARLILENDHPDAINTYFGMRKISVTKLPGTDIPYVALNNKPIYQQTALDQAYHPDGFYTFPSDDFIKNEIALAKEIGLNGQRVHIKVPIPRKLYWADKLGHLIMADVPNSWGEPDEDMQRETRVAMEGMIARDYNHPSIFSWVLFNETWGLFHHDEDGKRSYTQATQDWVAQMYKEAKALDSTRLVEDNSACNYDHVVTDINTWHAYLPGYRWRDFLDNVEKQTFPGSPWNFTEGNLQQDVPMFNSECGNVWGYEGSTGDVDWSWDYHIMMNEFRRHPKVAGWLYTEHHDVINEWNGYWKYDRSMKFTGLEELVEGMRLNDLHSYIYLAPGIDLCTNAQTNETVKVPVRLSVMTDKVPEGEVTMKLQLYGWNTLGERKELNTETKKITIAPWEQRDLEPLTVTMPTEPGLYIYSMQLSGNDGQLIQSNFTTFSVHSDMVGENVLTFDPASFKETDWSNKQWNILEGLKVNGAGYGFFEYEVAIPEGMDYSAYDKGTLLLEVSSKPLHGKDKAINQDEGTDYMRGKGLQDPSQNPNSYPMTDEFLNPSEVFITINGSEAEKVALEDDPADHLGILSWHAQPRDGKLREAGTYGYMIKIPIDKAAIDKAGEEGKFTIRLEVPESLPGGLAIYGRNFGRYPFDPSIILE